jgi:hypothetical protein
MPKPIGGHYYFDVLPPIDRTGKTADEIVRQAETAIHQVAMQP